VFGRVGLASANFDSPPDLSSSFFHSYFQPYERDLAQTPNTCVGCQDASPQDKIEAPRCDAFYKKLGSDGTVRIQISFGYFDQSEGQPFVAGGYDFGYNSSADMYFAGAFRAALLDSCKGSMQACEFSEQSPGLLAKDIDAPNGRRVHVEIQVNDSSLTPLYGQNTGIYAQQQKEKTSQALTSFHNGIHNADVVFYVGHSRNGGGPDFNPPVLLPNLHPNYAGYYEKLQPGLKDLTQTLRQRKGLPLLGLFSCLSERHFGKTLLRSAPNTGFLFTTSAKLLFMEEVARGAYAATDSLLRFQCYSGFQGELNALSNGEAVINARNFLTDQQPVHDKSAIVNSYWGD
jgi:hypothetical protein